MGRKVDAMSGPRPTQLQACGVLRPIGEVTDGLVGELKFHRQIEKLHRLGPRPYGELLVEIGEQLKCRSFIDRRLEAYAALDPKVVRELDGDEFPRPPLYEAPK